MTDSRDTPGVPAARSLADRAAECRDHASHVRHELRGALAVLIPVLSALGSADLDPKQQEMLAVAERSVARLEQLVASVAGSGWFEVDKPVAIPSTIALRPLVEQLFRGLRASADGVTAALVNDVPESLPDVRVDEAHLRIVLMAALDNAVRFASPAGAVSVTAQRESSPDGPVIKVTVTDSGSGLERGQLERVFEFGVRGDNNQPRWAGLGVGLYVARELVREWGGSITAESAAGSGFAISLSVPVARGGNFPGGEE